MKRWSAIPILILLLSACGVDRGHVRWLYIDRSLDDEWYFAAEQAADAWRTAVGEAPRMTRDPHATPHQMRVMLQSECALSLHGEWADWYGFVGGERLQRCLGAAEWCGTCGTNGVWTVGLVAEAFDERPEMSNYWERLLLVTHELGHVLGAEHVLNRRAVMYPEMRATLDGRVELQLDDLESYWAGQ